MPLMKYYMIKIRTKNGLENFKVSEKELKKIEKRTTVLVCTYIGEENA